MLALDVPGVFFRSGVHFGVEFHALRLRAWAPCRLCHFADRGAVHENLGHGTILLREATLVRCGGSCIP
jgi:hypothetical protein